MIILTIIVTFIFTLISFLLGYFIAKNDIDLEDIKNMIPERKEKQKRTSRKRIGAIERPTAAEVNKKGSILEETEKEMARGLIKAGLKPKI